MSGSKKRLIYHLCDFLLNAAAIAADVLLVLFWVPRSDFTQADWLAISGLVLSVTFNLPALIHELGHLVFGLAAGMKAVRLRFSPFSRTVSGATEMFPKNGKHTKAKAFCLVLGGSVFNLLIGGAFCSIFFLLEYQPWLLYCGLLAPFLLYEGIRAFIPVELSAGKTDGAVLVGLMRNAAEEEVMTRVMKAQGILYRNTFQAVPREVLYDAPVVREDLPAFAALLLLRFEYELFFGYSEADHTLAELNSLREYLSPVQERELDLFCGLLAGEDSTVEIKKEPLFGVRDLICQIRESSKRAE